MRYTVLLILVAVLWLIVHLGLNDCSGASKRRQDEKLPDIKRRHAKSKVELPPKYDIVYPYVANKYGKRIGNIGKTLHEKNRQQNSKTTCGRQRNYHRLYIVIKMKHERLFLRLRQNRKMLQNHPSVDFMDKYGKIRHHVIYEHCHYTGKVQRQKTSLVALSNCDGLSGLIRTSKRDYLIEPLQRQMFNGRRNSSAKFPHIVYRVETALSWKNVSIADDLLIESHYRRHQKRSTASQNNYLQNDVTINPNTKLYLETLVAADHTVVKFHGDKQVAQYIMTLMNIVSTIYEDPDLNANIELVVVKILLLNKEKDNVSIVKRNTLASLQNVCKWANSIYPAGGHDVVIFLTRRGIGGPAGYAPLSSICNSEKSCAINKDEGLTSAFILAHEVAHVLGLSHDGDNIEGNNCSVDDVPGSIMAPIVQSIFNRYYWSKCSIAQFHKKRETWTCMVNAPNVTTVYLTTISPQGMSYTLDEQCRQEFGAGFTHCKLFMRNRPCLNLWCTKSSNSTLCSTKSGPPLDGTPCGDNKWCVNGHCERVNKRNTLKHLIQPNPRHGGWSEWGIFGHCSRTCGIGVQFRTRKCNKPEPANGGQYCKGQAEEFKLCNTTKCPTTQDFRAEQCKNIGRTIQLDKTLAKMTWLAHPITDSESSCKILCIAEKTNDVLNPGENLMDGTLCNYNGSTNICVQGQCQTVGCDRILNSSMKVNECGICNGTTSQCKSVNKTYSRIPSNRFTRVAVVPKRARHIQIKKHKGSPNFIVLQSRKYRKFILNGNKNQEKSHLFIALGAQFNYTTDKDTETITAPGPLYEEITVLLSVTRKIAARVEASFTIPKNKSLDSVISDDYYEWKVIGWTKCSKTCGRGIQTLKTTCVDSRKKKTISKRHCSLLDKPQTRKRTCNNFPCQFQWSSQPWEYCSHTCGSKGLQHREVNCVLQIANSAGIKVRPSFCSDEKPAEIQPCNIHPCPGSWEVGEWSVCSVTCDEGIRHRKVKCVPPENDVIYECGDKPQEEKPCENLPSCQEECTSDKSSTCSNESLYRYCIVPSYFKYCCKTCDQYINGPGKQNLITG